MMMMIQKEERTIRLIQRLQHRSIECEYDDDANCETVNDSGCGRSVNDT